MFPTKKTGYTSHEVCEKLDVCKKTLFNWEKEGLIPRISRDWRKWRIYSDQDIEKIKKVIYVKAISGEITPNKKRR